MSIDEDKADLENYLSGVRRFLMEALEEEELWIVYHPISRIVS
jgi:hypothetical protein